MVLKILNKNKMYNCYKEMIQYLKILNKNNTFHRFMVNGTMIK